MKLLQNILKNEKAIIQEIHDSFDNAQEELLKQATFIIEQHQPELSVKAERLEKLGFINSETVLKNKINKKVLLFSKQDANLVNYYKASYPFLKFLKEEQLDIICNKYNLIYAPVKNYKEDVPEKNITEIENTQGLRDEDEELLNYKFTNTFSSHEKDFNKVIDFLGKDNLSKKEMVDIYHEVYGEDRTFFKIENHLTDFIYHLTNRSNIVSTHVFADIEIRDRSGLFIAAPKTHFDLTGLQNKGKGFFKVKVIKDPIVFRYVKGGIQVLSKWGLEANDELLQNEILN